MADLSGGMIRQAEAPAGTARWVRCDFGGGLAAGRGRDPASGNQALLGELIQAWIDTGAQCP
jgi:hypothetical protein